MKAYLGVGTNIGNLLENIKNAIKLLISDRSIKTFHASSLYISEPVGGVEQQDFLNGVFFVETELSQQELFLVLKEIEKSMGRKKTVKYGPRIIDLDILFYEDKIYQDLDITIPHPHLHKRSFVLWPLCELNKDLVHPLFMKTVGMLKRELLNPTKVELFETEGFPGRYK